MSEEKNTPAAKKAAVKTPVATTAKEPAPKAAAPARATAPKKKPSMIATRVIDGVNQIVDTVQRNVSDNVKAFQKLDASGEIGTLFGSKEQADLMRKKLEILDKAVKEVDAL